MKKTFFLTICLALFLQIACGQTQTENKNQASSNQSNGLKDKYPNLRIQAEEVGKATINKDFTKVVDYSYPKFVDELGGRDKMIALVKKADEQIRIEFSVELIDIKFGEFNQFVIIDSEVFASLPMTLIMKNSDGKFAGLSSMVGISNDNGLNWKFVDGINQENFNKMFPKAANKIKVPDQEPPKPIENK